jgi:hypothetical protein
VGPQAFEELSRKAAELSELEVPGGASSAS